MNIESAEYRWASAELTVACKRVAPHVIAALQRHGVRRVLDVGCGNGSLCGVLSRSGFDVVGVENDPSGVAICRRTYPSIPFHHFGVQDSPERLIEAVGGRFDAVVCTEVIEHLYSPRMLFSYASGVLTNPGIVVVTVPYYGYLKNLLISALNMWDQHHSSLNDGGHIKFFSSRTLRSLIEQSGFQVLECNGIGRKIPFLWNTMIAVAKSR